MKRSIILVALSALLHTMLVNSASGQWSIQKPTSKRFQAFLGTKTFVVLDSSEIYNQALRKAIQEHWTVTSYEFITLDEYYKKVADESVSFVALQRIDENLNTFITSVENSFSGICCFMGGGTINKKGVLSFTRRQMIAYAPVDQMGLENPINTCVWRMSFMIRALNNAIEMMKEDKSLGVLDEIFDARYRKKAYILRTKTLLIPEEYLANKAPKFALDPMDATVRQGPVDEAAIKEFYKYKYRIATREEITQALESKQADVCILFKAGTVSNYVAVYDPALQEVIYSHNVPAHPYLSKHHLKDMSLAIRTAKEKK